MRRTQRPLAALALIALIGLIGAGCASSGTSGGSASGSTARAQAVRFAECMRDNGVSEFPDPDASGELTIDGAVNGSSLDPSAPAWKEAIDACKDLQPPGFTGRKRSAAQQKSALEFAQCMRDHGIKDFPDPASDGPLVDTTRIPSAAGRGAKSIPGFQDAMQTCSATYAGELRLKRR